LIPYWLLFTYFAVGALLEPRQQPSVRRHIPLAMAVGGLLIAFLIGFRYQVGADWEQYEFMFSYANYADLGRVLELGDPAYQLLNWTVQHLGGEIWLVNLVCGLIFTWGLLRFTSEQPAPWLAMTVAMPYLVVVVAMGYSRQAVAIGILLAGLASIQRSHSLVRYGIFVAIASLFHRTAVVAFPLVALTSSRSKLVNLVVAVAGGLALYEFFLDDTISRYIRNYVSSEYSAQGAAVRVAMSVLPAILFLVAGRSMGFTRDQHLVWRNFSLASLALLALLFFLPSSAAVDRLALYTIPLQIAVLSRVRSVKPLRNTGAVLLVLYSFAVMFVWLNFANHAEYWVPYKFYPF
jgi:hypothetical protein